MEKKLLKDHSDLVSILDLDHNNEEICDPESYPVIACYEIDADCWLNILYVYPLDFNA